MDVYEPTSEQVLALIEAALAAPSADNCHHVRFDITGDGLDVRTDPFFATCEEPHRRRLILLSYGAIGENMRVWLRAQGRAFTPAWFPRPEEADLLLRVSWVALVACDIDDAGLACLASRHTNRKFFRGPRLTRLERDAFERSAGGRDGLALDWFDAPDRRAALLRLIRRAETERFRHRRHHGEMFESIAFEAGWSSSTTERLAPGSLEVEAPLRPFFKALRHWPVMRVANWFGGATLLGLRAGDLPARWAPHVLAVTSRLPDRRAALDGGALFQRLWLTAESLGLALQPMAASAVLWDDEAVNGGGRVDLRRAWRDLLAADWAPVMVFRLGRAHRPGVRSMRGAPALFIKTRPAIGSNEIFPGGSTMTE